MVYFNLNLQSNDSTFNYTFQESILNRKYEIGLVKLEGSMELKKKYPTTTINSLNDRFIYYLTKLDSKNNNDYLTMEWVQIPEGNYTFNELISTIQGLLSKNVFTAKLNEDKTVVFKVNKSYSISFEYETTPYKIFGFEKQVLVGGKSYTSKNTFQESSDNVKDVDVFLKCNLIDDSFINETKIDSLYKFKYSDSILEKPSQVIYHKINKNPNKIILKIVDKNNNLIELKNTNLWVEIDLKILE